jgi:hypothetical protein
MAPAVGVAALSGMAATGDPSMDEDDVERIATVAARSATRDILIALGIDPDKPVEFQERMSFLKTFHGVWKTAITQVVIALVGLITVGIATAVWLQMGGPK